MDDRVTAIVYSFAIAIFLANATGDNVHKHSWNIKINVGFWQLSIMLLLSAYKKLANICRGANTRLMT